MMQHCFAFIVLFLLFLALHRAPAEATKATFNFLVAVEKQGLEILFTLGRETDILGNPSLLTSFFPAPSFSLRTNFNLTLAVSA